MGIKYTMKLGFVRTDIDIWPRYRDYSNYKGKQLFFACCVYGGVEMKVRGTISQICEQISEIAFYDPTDDINFI